MFSGQFMTVFFSLEKLEAAAGGDCVYLIDLLAYYSSGRKKGSKYIRKRDLYRDFRGKNWILNPEALVQDRLTDPLFIAQYIKLASRRSWTMYKLYEHKFLDLSFYPEVSVSQIKHNPLLTIQQNKVYFKHEGI